MSKPIPTEYRSTHITKVDPNTSGPTQDGIPKQFWARVLNYGVLDDYGTKFKPGTFTKSLQRRLPRLMYGHAGWENPSALLGRGVDYRDSSDGLDILFEFDDFNFVPMARQIAHQMTNDPNNPTLDQFSVGFKRLKDERASQAQGGGVWITEARLGETSVVVEGAVPGTKTLQFRDANGAVLEGQTIDANDAARLLAELSTGKIDLGDALSQVKQLAAYDPEPDEDPDGDEDPEPDEIDEDELYEGFTLDQWGEINDYLDAVAKQDKTTDEEAAAKQAEEDAALAELSDVLVTAGSRHPFVETRGEHGGHPFHGNQHGKGGGGGSSSSGGGTKGGATDAQVAESARLYGGNVYHMKSSSPALKNMSHEEIGARLDAMNHPLAPKNAKKPVAGNTLPKDVRVESAGRGKGHVVRGIGRDAGEIGTIKKNANGDYEWTSTKTGKSGVNPHGPKSLAMAKQQLLGHHNVAHYNEQDAKAGR